MCRISPADVSDMRVRDGKAHGDVPTTSPRVYPNSIDRSVRCSRLLSVEIRLVSRKWQCSVTARRVRDLLCFSNSLLIADRPSLLRKSPPLCGLR